MMKWGENGDGSIKELNNARGIRVGTKLIK